MVLRKLMIKLLQVSKLGKPTAKLCSLLGKGKPTAVSPEEYARCMELLQKYHPDEGKSALTAHTDNRKEYDLDIIVPCYNIEEFVKKCIDSILKQKTACKYRLLLIDDGSKDRTGYILDGYAAHPDVCVIHQENRGHSGARNTGLQMINARYVMFVDSDDMLSDGAIAAMMDAAEKTDADIVAGAFCNIDTEDRVFRRKQVCTGRIESTEDLPGFPWGKIYRADLFDGVCFPDQYWYEDTLMQSIIFYRAKTIFSIENEVYQYRKRTGSISNIGNKKPKSLDTVYVYRRLWEDRKALGLPDKDDTYRVFLKHVRIGMNRMRYQPMEIQKAAFTVWCAMKAEISKGKAPTGTLKDMERALECRDFKTAWIYAVLQ